VPKSKLLKQHHVKVLSNYAFKFNLRCYIMAQAMSFSPFKKPFEDQITEWERTLSMVSEVLDEW